MSSSPSPPPVSDAVMLARYPFFPQAAEALRISRSQHGLSLEDLIDSPRLKRARQRGSQRLMQAVSEDEGIRAKGVVDLNIHEPEGRLYESWSYLFVMLIVAASMDEVLLRRWAQGEAKRAKILFEQDPKALETAAATWLTRYQKDRNGIWKIGLVDYTQICPAISGANWRLVNRKVSSGWVFLRNPNRSSPNSEMARLLMEKVRESIIEDGLMRMKKLPEAWVARLAETAAKYVNEMRTIHGTGIELSEVAREDWPPCLNWASSELGRGVNVNHTGRFLLATMGFTLGLPKDGIVDLFRNAPDFSEEMTQYQVSQIADSEYTPPGCDKLRSEGCCPVKRGDDFLCDKEWMSHPLKYVRTKQKRRRYHEREDTKPTTNSNQENGSQKELR